MLKKKKKSGWNNALVLAVSVLSFFPRQGSDPRPISSSTLPWEQFLGLRSMLLPFRRSFRSGTSLLTTSKTSSKSEPIDKRPFSRIWTNPERPKWFQWVARSSCRLNGALDANNTVAPSSLLPSSGWGRLVTMAMSILGQWVGERVDQDGWGRETGKRLYPWAGEGVSTGFKWIVLSYFLSPLFFYWVPWSSQKYVMTLGLPRIQEGLP